MIRNWTLIKVLALAAILFTACTQDELSSPTGGVEGALPDGEYPLQIGSVSITAESSEEPWTRVGENEDGSGSVWQPYDAITVSLNGETATYTYDGSAWTSEAPLYWKNTQTAEVTAWYAKPQPNAYNGMTLRDQDRNGLAYVLRATANNASYDTPVSLQFKHQLAKVRVVTKGTVNVGSISIQYPDLCVVNEGIVTSVGSWLDLDLYKTYYEGIGTCWEINLPAGNDIEFCRVTPIENSAIMKNAQLTPPVTLEAGKVHTITITANREGTQTINLANKDYEITGDGIYYFSGTASHAIRVKGGNPEIYLEDAQISVSGGHAISITDNASPTIHVAGTDNSVSVNSSTYGAGIYVDETSSVTIKGTSTSDALTVTGGSGSAGIGGYTSSDYDSHPCGNISIDNVTLNVTSTRPAVTGGYAAAIGACGDETVGSITISNAVINANSGGLVNQSGASIGGGTYNAIGQTSFDITISNSELHLSKDCSYASYIGQGGAMGAMESNYAIISTAKITNSTIHNESGTEITQ